MKLILELSCRSKQDGMALDVDRIIVEDRKSTRLNSSHSSISYAVFCLKKKKPDHILPAPPCHTQPVQSTPFSCPAQRRTWGRLRLTLLQLRSYTCTIAR